MPLGVVKDAIELALSIAKYVEDRQSGPSTGTVALRLLYVEALQNVDVLERLAGPVGSGGFRSTDPAWAKAALALDTSAHQGVLLLDPGTVAGPGPPSWWARLFGADPTEVEVEVELEGEGEGGGAEDRAPAQAAKKSVHQILAFVCAKTRTLQKLAALDAATDPVRRPVRYGIRLHNLLAHERALVADLEALAEVRPLVTTA